MRRIIFVLALSLLFLWTISFLSRHPVSGFNASDGLKQARQDLHKSLKANDIAKAKDALNRIVEYDNKKAIKTILQIIPTIRPENYEAYWTVLNGLSGFTNPEALEELTQFILSYKTRPFARDALYIMKSNYSPNLIPLLARMLEKGNEELQGLALVHLSEIRIKESVETIVDFLKQLKPRKHLGLKNIAIESLRDLTGKIIGDDPISWISWWEENKDKPDVIAEPTGDESNTGTATDYLDTRRLGEYGRLKRLPEDKIIVITGECAGCQKHGRDPLGPHIFDSIENTLEQMSIPYTAVAKSKFDMESYKLEDKLVLIFNCNFWRRHCVVQSHVPGGGGSMRSHPCHSPDGSPHIHYSNKLSDLTIKKIRKFVDQGGYVFSEDWELEEVLERAFPDMIGHTKKYPNDRDVKVFPAPGSTTHPYLKGVFTRTVKEVEKTGGGGETIAVRRPRRELKVGEGKWKIDKDSPDIKIKNPKAVDVLLVSPELKTNQKEVGAVAVTFAYGKGKKRRGRGIVTDVRSRPGKTSQPGGRVMHVLSHFGKQTSVDDEFILQNLILNFLLEANKSYHALAQAPKKKR